MDTYISSSPEDTQRFAQTFIDSLRSDTRERGTATIVALQGNLGAGKTVFAKGVADLLGVSETVTSPTYVIQKRYSIPEKKPWSNLVHIDAYRLQGDHELSGIGWNELATDPNNLILLEWPEQVGVGVPERAYWIEITALDEERRKIELTRPFFETEI